MLELGETITIREEYTGLTAEAMYKILKQIGVEAVLINTNELRDIDQYFVKRLQSPIQHILSNVSPKEKDSIYGNLKQAFEKDIPGMGNLYVLNLLSPDDLKSNDLIKNHYEVMEPEHFLKNFMTQVGGNDVVVARILIYNTDEIQKILNSPEAQRIDFFILTTNDITKYLSDEEKELIKKPYGWEPIKEPPAKKPKEETPERPLDQGFIGPELPPSSNTGGATSPTDGNNEKSGSGEPSANQGGGKTDEGSNNPPVKVIPGVGNQNPVVTQNPNDANQSSGPGSRNPLPKRDINLDVNQRQFMEITNKYRAVPEISSAEGMREVYFKRSVRGSKTVKVSDIIIYENIPEMPEVKKLTDETENTTRIMREKDVILKTINNLPNTFMYSKTNPYAGSEACKECHEISYNKWKSSAHAKAAQTLKNKHQEKNEVCLKCHSTEWIQQPTWPEWTFDKFAPEMGCESCHGPGQAHIGMINIMVQSKNRQYWEDIKVKVKYLQTEGPLSKNTCLKCHDQANSPDFDFVKYWDKISHDEPEVKILPPPKEPEKAVTSEGGPHIPGQPSTPLQPPTKPKKDDKGKSGEKPKPKDKTEPDKKK